MGVKMTDVLVVGSFVVGMTVRLPRMPYPGESLVADLFDMSVGGKGTNLAVAAARLGKAVAIVARVGEDDFAEMAFQLYAREGIDAVGVMRTPGEKTAVGLVYLQANGENTIGFYRGANWQLSPADVLPHLQRCAEACVVAAQLEVPDATVAAALRAARQAGQRTILNPAPARPLSPDILAAADVLTPNEGEARVLAGLAATDDTVGMAAVAERLLGLGPRAVIVTLGANGCLLAEPGCAPLHLPAYPVNTVDTVGAGDAFNGALAAALAEGLPLPDAARLANVAAALSTTAIGTVEGLPTHEEVARRLAS